MNQHSLPQNRGLSTHHILTAATLAAMSISEAENAELALHSSTPALRDFDLNKLTAVGAMSLTAGITKMNLPAADVALTNQASRRAQPGAVSKMRHQPQVDRRRYTQLN